MQTTKHKITNIKDILPCVKRAFFGGNNIHNEKEESIILRIVQYISLPNACVTLEWSIAQIESSFKFLEEHPNDELEKKWLDQQIDTFNECLSILPFPKEDLKVIHNKEVVSKKNYTRSSLVITLPNKDKLVKELLAVVSIIGESKLTPRRLLSVVESIESVLRPRSSPCLS